MDHYLNGEYDKVHDDEQEEGGKNDVWLSERTGGKDVDEWVLGASGTQGGGLSNQSTQYTTHESNQLRGLGRGAAGGGKNAAMASISEACTSGLGGWEISSESVMQKIEESQKRQEEHEEKNYIIDDAELELQSVLEGDDWMFKTFSKNLEGGATAASRNRKDQLARKSEYSTLPVRQFHEKLRELISLLEIILYFAL